VLHRVKTAIAFECDNCQGVLITEATEISDTVLALRGWTAVPPAPSTSEWRHRCSACRTPGGPHGPYRRR
jgi:hypothetical protein